MKKIIKKYRKTALFVVLGAGIGFAYWHTSTLMGGLIGMVVVPSNL